MITDSYSQTMKLRDSLTFPTSKPTIAHVKPTHMKKKSTSTRREGTQLHTRNYDYYLNPAGK